MIYTGLVRRNIECVLGAVLKHDYWGGRLGAAPIWPLIVCVGSLTSTTAPKKASTTAARMPRTAKAPARPHADGRTDCAGRLPNHPENTAKRAVSPSDC